ncbi:MAG: hypothetical protein FJ102_09910 [Deltaproteobacteria bacterium]|nr:hypothetical protein [Deltaproteobacteria bacterium]
MVSALRVESTPPAAEVVPAPPGPRFPLLRAVGGMAGLGLAGALAGQGSALASAPAGLLAGAGVLCLTTPALVVAQQYLRMSAPPSAVVGAVWDAFTRAGLVALGAVPAVAWIAATSDLGPGFAGLLFAAIGAFATLLAIDGLGRAEQRAGGSFAAGSGLGVLWAGLASLVGLRLLFLFTA